MFRFTTRESVLLTLVVAMGIEWWMERTSAATARKDRDRWQVQTEALVAQLKLEGVRIDIRDGIVEVGGYSGPGFGKGGSAFNSHTASP